MRSRVPGVAWPGLPGGLGDALLSLQFQFERSQWWTPGRLLGLQFRQIRRLSAHAIEHVPYYRTHLDAAGVSDVEALDATAFRRWPILRTQDVQEHRADLLSRAVPPEHGPIGEKLTTGSTGMPKRVSATQAAQVINRALILRDHLWHGRDLSAKLCAIRFDVPSVEQGGWSSGTSAAFFTGPSALFNVNTDVDQQLEWLRWHEPAYLLTSPSNLGALVSRSMQTGRTPRGLRQVMTYSEALPARLRERVYEEWGAKLTDFYTCTEAGTIALQCPVSARYHVQSEAAYVELLNPKGEPCAPGELGRVVVTPLHNFAMPLLRYEIGDLAVAGEPCACGRGLPVLREIAGRTRNMACDPSGRVFQPGFDRVLEATRLPVRQAQFVQKTPDSIEMSYIADRDLFVEEMEAFRSSVAELFPYSFSIEFRRVRDIPRLPGGKYEGFISLVTDAQQGG